RPGSEISRWRVTGAAAYLSGADACLDGLAATRAAGICGSVGPRMVGQRTAERLDARIAAEQSEQRLPSGVAGLVAGGELIWSGGRGAVDGRRPDADVQYRCGSITKTFIAVAVMRLRDEGALRLEDTVARFLPDTGIGELTIAQLLSHSAGLRAETG